MIWVHGVEVKLTEISSGVSSGADVPSEQVRSAEENSLGVDPAVPGPQRRSTMFSSLRIRNYRLYFSGQVLSTIGTWMQRIAQDWLVLTLSGNSPVALGVAVTLQFLPTLLFSLWAGLLADRVDKRRLLIIIQSLNGLQALVLGVLNVTGVVQLWQVYLLCLALGFLGSVEQPTRLSFVSEMVGQKQIPNATALNASVFNLARLIGPAIAGYAITWVGTGWLFLLNAVSTVAVIIGLVLMDPGRLFRGPAVRRAKGQVRAGLKYVLGRPDLTTVMILVLVVSTVAINFFISLAIIAVKVFHTQADGYGLLSTALAIGTLAGALMAARRGARGRPRLRALLLSAAGLGIFELVAALMPTYLAFGIALVPVGYFGMTFVNTANSLVQTSVTPQMRGRVMGLYTLVLIGGNPVAGPMVGWLADTLGGRSPFVVGGIVSVCAAVICAAILLHKGGVKLPPMRDFTSGRISRRVS
jgi:MFS family permease